MLCCYGYALSKNKKRSKVKPFSNIQNITVYENKRKVKTVVPGKPLETIDY
tara:strand:- start:62 stop:214 length:153 start_codon:yes stop_codon:yes gene_type:complete